MAVCSMRPGIENNNNQPTISGSTGGWGTQPALKIAASTHTTMIEPTT